MTPKIEEAISQKTFENPYHKLRVNLLYTASWLKAEIKDFLDPFEITQQQFNILRILRGIHPNFISTKEMADRMIDKQSDTSRLVDRLATKNLVYKQPCNIDGRKIQVFITEDGLKLLEEIDKAKAKLDAILDKITPEEAEQMNELLDRMKS